MSLQGIERRRDVTSLSESTLLCACLSEASPSCMCFLQQHAPAQLSHLQGQGKDVAEEGKARRDPLPPQVEDDINLRATPAGLGICIKLGGEVTKARRAPGG